MGRIKKRITKKKTNIKKNIKLPVKRKQEQVEHKMTSEQQAKQNEMLKIMLARPQQILPQGITQQNDENKQKIDTLTRRTQELITERDNDRRTIARLEQVHRDIRNEQAQQRQLHQQNEIQAEAEQRLADERAATERLRRANAAFDISTEEGAIRQKIAELTTQEHDANLKREEHDAVVNKNILYQELLRKRIDVDKITEIINAQKDVIKSDDFKNPNDALKNAIKEEMLKKIEKENNDEIIKHKINTSNITAETRAKQEFIDDYKERRIHQVDDKGNWKKGRNGYAEYYLFEKDDKGKYKQQDSKEDKYTKQLADQVKARENALMELDRINLDVNNYKLLANEAIKAKIDNDNTQRELKRMKEFQESEAYKELLKGNEELRMATEIQAQQIEHQKKSLASNARLAKIEAEMNVVKKFNPSEADTSSIQTQIAELSKQAEDIFTSNINAARQAGELNLARGNMHATLDSLLSKYEGENRTRANNNLLDLINHKTNSKLPSDLDEYSKYHMERATDLMKLVNERDPELLLNGEKLDAFIQEDTYKNFEWNDVE